MGLIKIVRVALVTTLLLFSAAASAWRGDGVETMPWTGATKCERCTTLQYGALSLTFPPERIPRVLVLPRMEGVHLFGPDNEVKGSVLLGAETFAGHVNPLVKSGLLTGEQQASAEAYFDSLANGTSTTTAIQKLRSIEGFARAQRTYKLARGPLRAWLLKAAPPDDDSLIIVVSGQQMIYRTLGHLTPAMAETLLANMSVAAIP